MALELLKVSLQAFFVERDAEGNLIEFVGQPMVYSSAQWPKVPIDMIERTLWPDGMPCKTCGKPGVFAQGHCISCGDPEPLTTTTT